MSVPSSVVGVPAANVVSTIQSLAVGVSTAPALAAPTSVAPIILQSSSIVNPVAIVSSNVASVPEAIKASSASVVLGPSANVLPVSTASIPLASTTPIAVSTASQIVPVVSPSVIQNIQSSAPIGLPLVPSATTIISNVVSSSPGLAVVDITSTLNINPSTTATGTTALTSASHVSSISLSSTKPSVTSSIASASSTVVTNSDQSSSGLSTGGKIAIGVVVPVVVLSLLGVAFFFLWRHKKRKAIKNEIRQQVEDYQFNPNVLVGAGAGGDGFLGKGSDFNINSTAVPFNDVPLPPAPVHGLAMSNSGNDYNNTDVDIEKGFNHMASEGQHPDANTNNRSVPGGAAGLSASAAIAAALMAVGGEGDATPESSHYSNPDASLSRAASVRSVNPANAAGVVTDHDGSGAAATSTVVPSSDSIESDPLLTNSTPILEPYSPQVPIQSSSRRGSNSAEGASGGYRGWGITSQVQTPNTMGVGMSPVPPIAIHRPSSLTSSNPDSPTVTNNENSKNGTGLGLGLGLPVPSVPRKSHRRTTSQSFSSIQSWEANNHKRNRSSVNDDLNFQLQHGNVPTTPPPPFNINSTFEESQRYSTSGTMGLALDSPIRRPTSGTLPLSPGLARPRSSNSGAPSPRIRQTDEPRNT